MTEQEFMQRCATRAKNQCELSDERRLGRLEGLQLKVEQDLYRIDNMNLPRTREILENELAELDMLIEFQKKEIHRTQAKDV